LKAPPKGKSKSDKAAKPNQAVKAGVKTTNKSGSKKKAAEK